MNLTGIKTGGRVKGTPNKRTVAKAAAFAASGLEPMDFLLKVMRSKKAEMVDRIDAAKALMPFKHMRQGVISPEVEPKAPKVAEGENVIAFDDFAPKRASNGGGT